MKKILKRMTVSLTATLMLCGSTYATLGSVSATDNDIQPRGAYHVYGDVDDNGVVDINDAVFVAQFMTIYKSKHGNTIIPVEWALDYLTEEDNKYYLPVPQAADIDGDGYITEADQICIQYYEARNYERAGRCGQLFYIN
ncbi:MAG: hypothetical protein K2H19_05625 [Ruminococcus sp.]|nr:hypothetical protein [Ruminococcus sp.]